MEHDQAAQLAGENALETLWEGDDCQCPTCCVREVLEAALPHLYAGLVELMESHGATVPAEVVELFSE